MQEPPIQASLAESVDAPGQPLSEEELVLAAGKFPTDRYIPLGRLGRGAAGVVYSAQDRLLNKDVAVKILLDLTGEQLIAFQEEARATSKLRHDNIITVLDFGASESGTPYMVMELVNGETLETILRESGPLPEEEAIHIIKQLCSALSCAHQNGIFHRDLKPSNVLLIDSDYDSPEARLIDFGIAKVKEATGRVTEYQSRTLAGTPAYIAPDPVLGHKYDERSEIYSVGCLFFEMIAGEPPFLAETALETISLHVHQPPRRLSQLESAKYVSTTTEEIVAKCLAKNPSERFQSMEKLLDALNTMGESSTNSDSPRSFSTSVIAASLCSTAVLGAVLFLLNRDLAATIMSDSAYFRTQAWSLAHEDKFEEALHSAQQAIVLKNNDEDNLDTRGTMHYLVGHNQAALNDLNNALSINPKHKAAHFHRALVYGSLGDHAKCKRGLVRAERLGYVPDSWDWTKFKPMLRQWLGIDQDTGFQDTLLASSEKMRPIGKVLSILGEDLSDPNTLAKLSIPNNAELTLKICKLSKEFFSALRRYSIALLIIKDCSGLSPDALAGLAQLRTVTNLNLTDIPQLTGITFPNDLQCLSLRHCRLDQTILNRISDLTALQYLNLNGCKLTRLDLSPMLSLPKLTCVELRNCKGLSADHLKTVGQIEQLELLLLSNSIPSEQALNPILKLKHLKRIDLWGCSLSEPFLRNLNKIESLSILSLGPINASNLHLSSCLNRLRLTSLGLTDPDAGAFNSMPNVQKLKLDFKTRSLDSKSFMSLTGVPALDFLEVTGKNAVTARDVAAFKKKKPSCDLTIKVGDVQLRSESI